MRKVSAMPWKRLSIIVLCAWLSAAAGCRKPVPPPTTEVVLTSATTVPSEPADQAWRQAPEYRAALILQDLVEPRQLAATTPEVRVRAITDGSRVAFRLEWDDATANNLPGASRFIDACAVQLPRKIEVNLPAPQMGETGRGVEIAYWNAAAQARVDGRGDSIKDLYPNAAIDHYPFEAEPLKKAPATQEAMAVRYSPARAAGNQLAEAPTSPVQDLIAEGPGTLSPAPSSTSRGKGVRTATGWAVVIVREMPSGTMGTSRPQVAFAVWDGSKEEVGARKMRTAWVPTSLKGQP